MIDRDSTLLVEHLDRVTREKPLKAQELFTGIFNRGLILVTLNDGAEYSEASLNGHVSKLLIAVIRLSSANDENEKKSKRIRERFDENLPMAELTSLRFDAVAFAAHVALPMGGVAFLSASPALAFKPPIS